MRELAYRIAVAGGCRLDPTPSIVTRHARRHQTPRCRLALVYTARSPECVRTIVADAASAGFDIRLWALDRIDPELAPMTIGSGPGSRLALHNALAGSPGLEWLVVADDDVRFEHGTIVDFVRTAAMLGLDIAQPAHERGSYATHRITRRLPFHAARETTFVECGPIVAFSPRAAARSLPFPDFGMGWGLELLWHDLQTEGYRLGIVDSASIVHLFRAARSYDNSGEEDRLNRLLRERGLTSLADIQANVRRVPLWRI